VPGLRRLTAAELTEVEPHCRGVAALHSPATGIADFPAVARELAREVTERGGRLLLGVDVTGVEREGRDVRMAARDGQALAARHAVFCAGQWADRLARAAGAGDDPRIVPFRGRYLRLRPEARGLVRGLIYPVPDPELPFLGVHLTRHVSGDVLLGPSALLAPRWDTFTWPGTWRVMRRWWRTGLDELRLQAGRRAFVAACARYVPELRPEHVDSAAFAGVRAQAVGRDGTLVDDFVFSEAGATLHVRNAPSPGATSSLAIGEMIAQRAAATFDL
jgi:2-hydroxyglutarate dehydrogenase